MAKEVTVSSTQGITRAISEVATLLETEREATITAINFAIPSAVNLVELVKHRIKGLYQQSSFEKVKDSNKTRVVFKLSFKALNPAHAGYQAPIAESEVTEKSFAELKNPPQQSRWAEGERPERTQDATRRAGERGPRRARGGPARELGSTPATRTENKEGQAPRGAPRERRVEREPRGGSQEKEEVQERAERGRGNRGDRGGRTARGERGGRVGRGGRFGRGDRGGRGARGSRGGRGDRGGRGFGGDRRREEPGMEKYQLIRERQEPSKDSNEVLVSAKANPIFAIKNALVLFKKNQLKSVVIKATGQAISSAIRVVEEVKRKEPGLHQLNSLEKRTFKDHYKATEQGLDDIYKERTMNGIQITLSKTPLDTKHTGYQAPIADSLVTNLTLEQVEKL